MNSFSIPPIEIVDNKTGKIVVALEDQGDDTYTMRDENGMLRNVSIYGYNTLKDYVELQRSNNSR